MAVDVAGESVIVVRTKAGELRAFYNVCRHRGSRLCDEESGRMKGAVKCPYHAWSYSFDGKLIGTPNVGKDEVDRDALGLWPVSVDVAGLPLRPPRPRPGAAGRGCACDQPDAPLSFARYSLEDLRIGHGRWSRWRPTGRS